MGQKIEQNLLKKTFIRFQQRRVMNPVAMTIINPGKEYWPSWGSNERATVLKSSTLWGSAILLKTRIVTTRQTFGAIYSETSSVRNTRDWYSHSNCQNDEP